MQFRTELSLTKSKWNIDYNSSLISVGSCFSTNISSQLNRLQFKIENNPYGTLYNPYSIFRSLIYEADDFKDTDLQRDEKWVSYLCHSDLSSTGKQDLTKLLDQKTDVFKKRLESCDYLILTLGSSKVYTLKSSGLIVANCHKVSQHQFETRLLRSNEIVEEFEKVINNIKSINPGIKIIISVSPVRYLSDGFEKNSLSKSTLITACHEIVSSHDNVEYFPAYEIIMDDLRDYRFYEEDLLHPNSVAIKYVFDGFVKAYMENETILLMGRVNKIIKSLEHIPFNRNSESYKKLMNKLEAELENIKSKVNIDMLSAKLADIRSI